MGTRRGEADEVAFAVKKGGAITRPTLDRLLELLKAKTTYRCHIAVEVLTPTMLKTIDNENGALETIRRLESAPDAPRCGCSGGHKEGCPVGDE